MSMSNTRFSTGFFVALSALVWLAQVCVSVDAKVPDVSVTQKDLGFAAMPAELTGEYSISAPFKFAHDKLEFPDGLATDLRAVSVTLTANRGIEDFSFMQSLHVSIADGKNPTMEIASFDRYGKDGATSTATKSLVLRTLTTEDTLKMWQTQEVTFTVELGGSLPKTDWSLDVDAHFSGAFGYDL